MWMICTVISIIVLLVSIGFAIARLAQRKTGRLTSLHILIIGAFSAGFLILFPPYYTSVLAGNGVLNSLLIVFHDTLRLFTADADYGLIFESLGSLSEFERSLYTVYSAFLYAFTPLLSLGFLLSFFRGVASYWKVLVHYWSNIYVFSEINEHAVALIESIVGSDKDALIVYADVGGEGNAVIDSVIDKSGIIRIKCDICELKFAFHSEKSKISYFFMSDDAGINVSSAMLASRTKAKQEMHLYVFSSYEEHDAVLCAADSERVIIHRINTMQSLVEMFLYKEGIEIFESAVSEGNDEKTIRIGIVGLGSYGREFARNLPWYTVRKGYRTEIHIFDKNTAAVSSFKAIYPELNYDIHSNAHYLISFHECDVESAEFASLISGLPAFTYFIVTTGNDDRNLRISFRLRALCRRYGSTPLIRTRIYNPVISSFSSELKNHKEMPYDIKLLGSLVETYSYEAIIRSAWADDAILAQKKYGRDDNHKNQLVRDYYKYEYTRSSTNAYTIYNKISEALGAKLSEEERNYYEHERWCAFMYAHSYTYAPVRDDIALTNPNLVPYFDLPVNDK